VVAEKGEARDGAFRRFAWAGFSFPVPAGWELAEYFFGRDVSSVQLEDAVGLRLEFEWCRPGREVDVAKAERRYLAGADRVKEVAEQAVAAEGLPEGWSGFGYAMPERRVLATAYWVAPDRRFAGYLRLHLADAGVRKALRILRRTAGGFALHGGPAIPWEFYDVSLTLSRDFRLASTNLQAGRKLMVFEWRLRRCFVWQHSFADMILKKQDAATWGAEFLNQARNLHGPVFQAVRGERIRAARSRRYPLGHYDEIGRMSFRYRAACVHWRERNALLLACYHYRSPGDLEKLRSLSAPAGLADALLRGG